MNTHESKSRMVIETEGFDRGRFFSIRRSAIGLALLSGVAAVAWTFDTPLFVSNHQTLAAASKPKAGADSKASKNAKSDPDSGTTEESRVKLNYVSAPWQKVFQDLSDATGMEVICDTYPTGRFARIDKTEYTRKDAIRIINSEIEKQGLRLIEKGDFLIVIETVQVRAEYPPAVLPKRNSTKPAERRGSSKDDAEAILVPRKGEVNSAVYQEESDDRSQGRSVRQLRGRQIDVDDEGDRPLTAREILDSRRVRQTSLDDAEGDSDRGPARRLNPGSLPPSDRNVAEGERAPHSVYRARHATAVDLAKRVYRAMNNDAELVNAGRNGLPGFRVVNPQFVANNASKSKKTQAQSVEFMISIDEERNELLIDGSAREVSGVVKLLRLIDRPAEEDTQTYIKPSSKFVCQAADQLPAEIERIRAAANGRAIARRPVDERPVRVADEDGRNVPNPNDNRVGDENQPADSSTEGNSEFDEAIGNFKGEVNIETIDDLNVMIIRGNQRDVDQILKVIERIEKLSLSTAPVLRLHRLANVDAESLAELMISVYEKLTKFPGRATQPRESIAIIPVAKPNSLLIVAPQADLDTILELVKELDQPVDPQTEFEVFPLKFANAMDVEVMLTNFYQGRTAMGTKVLIIPDSRSNALIIRARPRDLEEITTLIKKVDRDDAGASVNQVKIFVLKNAVATDMAAVINSAIQSVLSAPRATSTTGGLGGQGGQQGLGGGQVDEQFKSAKSAVLQFLTSDRESARQIRSGVLADIRITPDLHTNALIVTATEKSMELMTALIQQLDRPTSAVSVIKVFTLLNADASLMVQQLNALFNNVPQGQGQNQNRLFPGLAIANADDANSSLIPLKFSVDTRTNSVIAVGSADAMGIVEAVLAKLDENNLRSRQNKVVRLNNAPALQISQAITAFFQQQRDLTQNDPNLVSNVEQLEREVIVIPDTISNNLLVSATPRYFPDILQMIAKLDSVPKVVFIQAMIVEVQLNNTDEFGIELGLQSPVFFQRSVLDDPVTITNTTTPGGSGGTVLTNQVVLSQSGSPGFNFNNSGIPLGNNLASSPGIVGGQSLTNFSMGRANSDLGYGGLVLSAGSNSVNALLRALAYNRRLQILSRPQIRVLDNMQAEVFVGQNIPTVTNFTTNQQTGVISPQLTLTPTGISMQVLPRINQEGNVVIQLFAFRSQLSRETVNVTTDSRGQPVGQRIIDISRVTSTVLVPSNSTIVIGGMINSRDESSTRKAPLLGDIPVLGQLFRFDSRSTIRSELLIFLTPRIVEGAEAEECLKEIEMGRIHFIESEAEAMHGPLRAIPAPDDVFMDENPNWIHPPLPPGEHLTPPLPLPHPTTNELPPSPTLPLPTVPSPSVPSPPDANISQVHAMRSKMTEEDDSKSDTVSQASYAVPAKEKPKKSLLKRNSKVKEAN